MCDAMAQFETCTLQQQDRSVPDPLSAAEDMHPEVVRSCGESVGIASLLRDVCHLEVSEGGFVRSPVNSSRKGSTSEAPNTPNSARADSAREEPPRFFAATAATTSPRTRSDVQPETTPKRAQKLRALKITFNRLLSRSSSSTVCCVDDTATLGHRSGVSAAATHRSRRRRHSGLLVVPVSTAAVQKQQHLQHRNSSLDCSRTRECSPTSSTSSTCSLSPQPHHSASAYERQQQLHRHMLPADALIERHSGFSNLNDWFAEINSCLDSNNGGSSSTCGDSEYDENQDEDPDECCRSHRMQTDDPTFYRS